ncbi:MAG: RluA family pseudouridine synthase [Deltaproteobacteria bacterium]|nr:RluA family pseudouridine synthase [Deltaproteobacteria bacterium]
MAVCRVAVGREHQGMRLDLFLTRHLGGLYPEEGWNRSGIQKMIGAGRITVNGRTSKPANRVKTGDRIEVLSPLPKETSLVPEAGALDVLYEDEDCLVLNKPPGIAVHPGAGRRGGTLANQLLHHCPGLAGVGSERRPGIVHRLDKDTSGVMVVAKTALAFQHLVRQFKERRVDKEYVAFVWGKMPGRKGLMDRPIGRHRSDRKRMSTLRAVAQVREALTEWHTISAFKVAGDSDRWSWVSFLRLKPRTGRTHQIRVHLAEQGNPVVGDRVYGGKRRRPSQGPVELRPVDEFPRQALHAERLAFQHPRAQKRMEFCAPMAEDMRQLLAVLKAGQLEEGEKYGQGG